MHWLKKPFEAMVLLINASLTNTKCVLYILSWLIQLWRIASLSAPHVRTLVCHYRLVNRVTLKRSGNAASSLTVKTKGEVDICVNSCLYFKESFFVEQSREDERYKGRIKSKWGKKSLTLQPRQLLCLRQAPNLWFRGSKVMQHRKMILLRAPLLK